MAEITEQRRRYYSGLDADIAAIPASGKAVGDQFFATDTKLLYFWDGAAWDLVLANIVTAAMLDTDAVETAKIKNLNVTKGKAELGFGRFVSRRAAVVDFSGGNPGGVAVDFDTDGNWQVDGLDLSGIVPEGAVAVVLALFVVDDAAASYFMIRPNATDAQNRLETTISVANIGIYLSDPLAIDNDRLLDYRGSNLTFTTITVTVVGWFI